MTNTTNNDIEELEELLTELEGQEARLVAPYTEDDDAVTTVLEAPLNDQEWMVQVTPVDRRMMGTEQVVAEWRAGKISGKTLVWRTGMNDWTPIGNVAELRSARELVAGPSIVPPAPQPSYPPPAPMPANSASLAPPPVARPAPLPPATLPSSPVAVPAPGAWGGSASPASVLPPPPAPRSPGNVTLPGKLSAPPMPAPAPVAVAAQPEFAPAQTSSTRPVAVDYPAPTASRGGSKKVLVGLGMAAVSAVAVMVMVLTGGDEESAAAPAPAAQPQTVMNLNPGAADKAEKKPAAPAASAKEAEASAEAKVAEAKAAEENDDEDESTSERRDSASSSAMGARAPSKASTRYVSRESSRPTSRRDEQPEERERPTRATEQVSTTASADADGADVEDGVVQQEPDDSKNAVQGGKRFDKEAAASVLNDAAEKAKNCRPKGGPTGKGRVRIRYEPSGKVSSVSILTSKFENTVAGSCITMLFRRAQVPEFGGGAVVVNKSFEIP